MTLLEQFGYEKIVCAKCGNDTFKKWYGNPFTLTVCANCGSRETKYKEKEQ